MKKALGRRRTKGPVSLNRQIRQPNEVSEPEGYELSWGPGNCLTSRFTEPPMSEMFVPDSTPLPEHSQPAEIDRYLVLAGRAPFDEFVGYWHRATGGKDFDPAAAMTAFRSALGLTSYLAMTDGAAADASAAVQALPTTLWEAAAQVMHDPRLRRTLAILPSQIAMVELDKLTVRQKHINLSQIARIRGSVPAPGDVESAFTLCLQPHGVDPPPVNFAPLPAGGHVFSSASNDLRVVDVQLLDPSAFGSAVGLQGDPKYVLVVAVGYSTNLLHVFRGNNRLLIQNGSHRAYALREAGHTHAPALVQDIAHDGELAAVVGAHAPAAIAAMYGPQRPAVLRDFFDPALRVELDCPTRDTAVRVTMGIEVSEFPKVIHPEP